MSLTLILNCETDRRAGRFATENTLVKRGLVQLLAGSG